MLSYNSDGLLKLVAGPFAAAVSLIWSDDKIVEYLTASDARRQIWHACLAAPAATFRPESTQAAHLHHKLSFWRAKNLIAQAYGCRPRGVLQALAKLGTEARQPEIYPLLVDILDRGGAAAKTVMHAEQLSDALIDTLAALPAQIDWQTINVLVGELRDDAPEDLALFTWTASRIAQVWPDADIRDLLQSKHPLRCLRDHLIARDFPAAPWVGTSLLAPILTGRELIKVGASLGNCLAEKPHGSHEILKVLNESKYFYEWRGRQPALIEMVRVADIGWYVVNARGNENTELTHATRAEIFAAFAVAANICATRLIARSRIYPSSRFWGEIISAVGY